MSDELGNFFEDAKLISRFTHRGRDVQIYQALRKSVCCGILHKISDEECLRCESPLRKVAVQFLVIEGVPRGIPLPDLHDLEDLEEFARLLVDDMEAGILPLEELFEEDEHVTPLLPPPLSDEEGGAELDPIFPGKTNNSFPRDTRDMTPQQRALYDLGIIGFVDSLFRKR